MIVELIGLPGAGKSTIVKYFFQLKDASSFSISYQEVSRKILEKNFTKLNFVCFVFSNLFFLLKVTTYYLRNSKDKKSSFKRILAFSKMLFLLKKNDEDKTIIMDQGLVQMLISLERYNTNRNLNKFEEILKKSFTVAGNKKYNVVYVELPLHTSKERIREREKTTCEFKNMKENHLDKVLKQYTALLTDIENDLCISSLEDPKINANIIYQHILKEN